MNSCNRGCDEGKASMIAAVVSVSFVFLLLLVAVTGILVAVVS